MADGSGFSAFRVQPGLPSSNRGVSEFRNAEESIPVCIDWLSASVDLFRVLEEQGVCGFAPGHGHGPVMDKLNGDGSNVQEVASQVFAFYFGGSGLILSDETKAGRFYKYRVPILNDGGEFVGQLELGGESTIRQDGAPTVRLELTGDGCRIYEAAGAGGGHGGSRWLELRAKLESTGGRLTRVDIAADDLAGMFPISLARQWHTLGEFDNRGQTPVAQLIDDCGSRKGKTFNVGSRKSEKFLRIYEKGRERGDPDSEWVRFEGEFKASSRKELTLDMLRDPAAYLRGAFPVLRFVCAMLRRIDVTDAANAATWKSCRRHLKRQYGATLRFIIENTNTDADLAGVIRSLTSKKLPTWASKQAANNWPEIILASTPTDENGQKSWSHSTQREMHA